MGPRHLTVLRKRHVLEFLVFLQDNKKLSPRTFLGYRHSLSIPFKEAFEINFADRDLSTKLGSTSLRPLKESFPNGPSITLQTPRFRNSTASLEDLFLKTIFLVAVTSGNRCSQLAACTSEGISFDSNTVIIPTIEGFLFKTKPWTERLQPPSLLWLLNINYAQPLHSLLT